MTPNDQGCKLHGASCTGASDGSCTNKTIELGLTSGWRAIMDHYLTNNPVPRSHSTSPEPPWFSIGDCYYTSFWDSRRGVFIIEGTRLAVNG